MLENVDCSQMALGHFFSHMWGKVEDQKCFKRMLIADIANDLKYLASSLFGGLFCK